MWMVVRAKGSLIVKLTGEHPGGGAAHAGMPGQLIGMGGRADQMRTCGVGNGERVSVGPSLHDPVLGRQKLYSYFAS